MVPGTFSDPLFVNRQQGVDESVPANRQQGVDEFEMLFLIPWSHHTRIIDKVKGSGRVHRRQTLRSRCLCPFGVRDKL